MPSQDWFNKDFYATLGVSKDADADAIKKAYRKLARDLHPDRNPGDAAAEKRFKEVGEAYAVLSDTEDRQQYDAIRAMGGGGARFQAGGGGAGGAAGFEDILGGMFGGGGRGGAQFRTSGGGTGGFEDILGSMFGGGFQRGPQKGGDIAAAVEVTFRDAAEGSTVTLGSDGQRITTRLPVGVKDGQRIRVPGKGRPGSNGGPAGDLLLTVHVQRHPVFTIDGLNLKMKLPVRFDEAALGAHVEVPTLSGERVKVKVPSGTQSGTVLRVKGRGLASKKGTGDLMVTVEVAVPRKLSRDAKKALEALTDATAGEDPRASLYTEAAR
ncbi:DnaJ C-terminal domain-containing protein [Demequina sp. SYSU T00039]|uniref:DnaJ C-terminal domain-containing protein n=1 Tax=Demequina lignilytica TaxID=3051663 RepID=A0AAW7M512_9MICO|nr:MULTISPECIES: DnaJ C-terminal domain-containing protein [unclassified Demequina]MDN4479198.1 DnaJ C-terminal domain-containing protein [Demequina sp. SYSU T00039-1]MDN4487943.1 DnaJ C-terminal domain-containing protein [Demequina sp. SYSU T00039]MDN4491749.1 DnaJ C-terminal domain-containing protein [Demequina sp. SYSU T00068]